MAIEKKKKKKNVKKKKKKKYGENKTASQIKPCLCFLFCVEAIKKPFLPI